MSDVFWSIDLPALITAVLAAVLCSLLGSFLVLRRETMMADSLSHAVLPGLALAYLLSGSMDHGPMMLGALVACLLATLCIRFLKETMRIESGASMGIVFTTFFAVGLVLLEVAVGDRVHLDAHHALFGGLELMYWPVPHTLETMPEAIVVLAGVLLLSLFFIGFCFRPLALISFDPIFARSVGIVPRHYSVPLMILVAMAAVASFEAVGSVLVIALFICPAAAARMFCDRLRSQLWLSGLLGCFCGVTGYAAAALLPLSVGYEHALSASGMIALMGGLVLLLSILFAPVYGVLFSRQRPARTA